MSRRVDAWLRADRLDLRWRDPAGEPAPVAAPAPSDDPQAWCARLLELAATRFPAGGAMMRLLDELAHLTAGRFPHKAPVPADRAELDARIEELIANIEDLADAAAVAGGRR